MDGLELIHAEWIRFDFNWADIQASGSSSYNWSRYDAVVNAANDRNIRVLGMIGYTPDWARPSGCTNDKCHPDSEAQFAAFVGQVVGRYKDQNVKHWEIWNEPNIINFWQPAPDAAAYSVLLQQAYTAVKSVDASAFVVSGGMSPATSDGTNIAPTDFLTAMYANGTQGYFDALGHHPYCYAGSFDCPNTYAAWSAWSQMSETPVNLRGIMSANADSAKKIWITEFGAPTNGAGSVSTAQQATMLSDAYENLASESWAGPLFWYSYQDAGTNTSDREDWFGMLTYGGSRKTSYDAFSALYVAPEDPAPSPSPSSPSPSSQQPTSSSNEPPSSANSARLPTPQQQSDTEADLGNDINDIVSENPVVFQNEEPAETQPISLEYPAAAGTNDKKISPIVLLSILAPVSIIVVTLLLALAIPSSRVGAFIRKRILRRHPIN